MFSKIYNIFTSNKTKDISNEKILTDDAFLIMTAEHSFSKLMHIYSINNNKITHSFDPLAHGIESIALAPNKKKFFVANDGGLYQFNMHSNKSNKVRNFKYRKNTVMSHDGRYLVAVRQQVLVRNTGSWTSTLEIYLTRN